MHRLLTLFVSVVAAVTPFASKLWESITDNWESITDNWS